MLLRIVCSVITCLLSVQAIDGDCNQTGQMIASLLDWPQVQPYSVV